MRDELLLLRISNELQTIIEVKDIYFAVRWDKNSIKIYYRGGSAITRMSLNSFQETMCSYSFERTHKSFVVNLTEISEIHSYFNNYLIKFKSCDDTALLTPDKFKVIKSKLISI